MSANEASQLHRGASNLRVTLGVVGLIAVVLGLLILIFPGESGQITMKIVAGFTAVYAFIVGIAYLGNALFSKTLRAWGRIGYVLLGLLYVVGGIIMLFNLSAAAAVIAVFLAIVIGVIWLFEGIVALTTLSESPHRGWTVFYAILSILAGLALIFSPILGIVTLWLLLGISMVVLGVVQIVRAFTTRPKEFANVGVSEE